MSYDDDEGIPAIRGWITKQGGSHKSWKKRWIQTTPRNPFRLDYYTNDSCSTLKGHIDMSGVTDMITTRSKDKDDKMRYGFQLVTEKRTWKIIVEGETDGEYFRDAFRRLINQVRKSKGLPPLEKKKKKKSKSKHHSSKKRDDKKTSKPSPAAAPSAPKKAPVKAGSGQGIAVAAPPPTKSVATQTQTVAAAPPPPIVPVAAPPPPPPVVPLPVHEEEDDDDDQNYENVDEEVFEGEEEVYDDDYEEEGDDIDESEYFDTDIRECEEGERYAVVLHQYDSTTETELSVQRGQKLIIFDDSDPDGWLGAETRDGERGWVSAHFVKFI